jgi:hypothetical protein
MAMEQNLNLVVAAEVVERLLARQHIRVEEFRCGDLQATVTVRRMLLNNLRQSLAAQTEPVKRSKASDGGIPC